MPDGLPSTGTPDATIRLVQGEIALGRLSAAEISRRYGVSTGFIAEVRTGLRQPMRTTDPEVIPRVLSAYADAITEPLGVLSDGADAAEAGEEDLQLVGAAERYQHVQAAKRRAIRVRRDRVTSRSGRPGG